MEAPWSGGLKLFAYSTLIQNSQYFVAEGVSEVLKGRQTVGGRLKGGRLLAKLVGIARIARGQSAKNTIWIPYHVSISRVMRQHPPPPAQTDFEADFLDNGEGVLKTTSDASMENIS